MTDEQKLRQDMFIRVCRDSGFRMEYIQAAKIAAATCGCHPIDIWCAMPSLYVMEKIAKGEHEDAICVSTVDDE